MINKTTIQMQVPDVSVSWTEANCNSESVSAPWTCWEN